MYPRRAREFHEPGFWRFSAQFLCGFVVSANLAVLVLHGKLTVSANFTRESVSLRKSPQRSAKLSKEIAQTKMSKSWRAKLPALSRARPLPARYADFPDSPVIYTFNPYKSEGKQLPKETYNHRTYVEHQLPKLKTNEIQHVNMYLTKLSSDYKQHYN